MGLKGLLTVYLEKGITNEQKEIFNRKLNELMWNSIATIPNAWVSSFKENITAFTALAETKKDVKAAADAANIKMYHCAVQFCQDEPYLFET